ncbi:MAG TPA: ABC transporter permease [Bryobacteraceae bacterium]|nr:ABC transporter permease [Bryobacteraceae bacterium]
MITLTRKSWAFIRRDFLIESSYKVNFMSRVVESMMLLIFFYFLSALITPRGSSAIGKADYHYFPFALVGLAFARYFELTLKMFSESIRQAQVSGCLEAMLSSQTGCVTIVLMSALYGLISGAVQLFVILIAGRVLFGVDFGHLNFTSTAVVFTLSIMIFVAIGVLSASMVIWLKQGDPITWVVGGLGSIIGGAYFPIDVMPIWMQKLSLLIPISYSLDALRLTILKGQSIFMVGRPIVTLAIIALILLPCSVALFASVIRKGRKEGTLMHY